MEKPLETVCVGPKLGEAGSQGITTAWLAVVLYRLLETQRWWPTASACQEGQRLNKETMDFVSTSCWEKTNPPTLIL